ncbi:MAG: hypothetical protein KA146_07665, partial [Leptospiraceae bacterium]|nr:hypothetical protein [Leptospiraceae bacterium]
ESIRRSFSIFTFYLLLNLVSMCFSSFLISSISDFKSSVTCFATILDKDEKITKKLHAIPTIAITIKYKLILYILHW